MDGSEQSFRLNFRQLEYTFCAGFLANFPVWANVGSLIYHRYWVVVIINSIEIRTLMQIIIEVI